MRRKGNDKPRTPAVPGERIAKVMARAGLCSRRQAEAWVAEGRVAVNGEVISSPARNVSETDAVTVDGSPLPQRERTRLFLYHKPRGLVTTHADPEGRPTIFQALPKHLPRLVSVGRLDINTEGLLLLTNDGALARILELPQTGWLRRYRVRALGETTQADLDRLSGGITLDGVRYGAIAATLDRVQGSNVWLTFAIREGKNREVKNVLGHLGLSVNRLIRVSFGPFQLGDMQPGDVEEVKTRTLREQLGDRLAALSHADFASPIVEREEPSPPRQRQKTPSSSGHDARREARREPREEPRRDENRTARAGEYASERNSRDRQSRARDDGRRAGRPVKSDAKPFRSGGRAVADGARADRGSEAPKRYGAPTASAAERKPARPRRRDRAGGPRPARPRG